MYIYIYISEELHCSHAVMLVTIKCTKAMYQLILASDFFHYVTLYAIMCGVFLALV